MATIEDVAAASGVSVFTVSRYLKGYKVKKDNEKRISAAIEKLDYHPNAQARRLRGQSGVIGVMLHCLDNIYHATYLSTLVNTLDEMGYKVMISMIEDSQPHLIVDEVTRLLKERWVDACVIFYPEYGDLAYVEQLPSEIKEKTVVVGAVANHGLSSVRMDDFAIMHLATQHLVERGCKHIGFAGMFRPTSFSQERYLGYLRGLKEAGLAEDQRLTVWATNHREVKEGLRPLLAEGKCDGFVAINDRIGIVVLDELSLQGIGVPDEIQVVGTDGLGLHRLCSPRLTTVCLDVHALARATSEQVKGKLRGEQMVAQVMIAPSGIQQNGTTKNDIEQEEDKRGSN